MLKNVFLICSISMISIVTGCATNAVVEDKSGQQANIKSLYGESFNFDMLYAQPEPGIFSGMEMQELKPVKQQEKTISSSNVLVGIEQIYGKMIPKNTNLIDSNKGYRFVTEIVAPEKGGPVLSDYNLASNLAMGVLTLGLDTSKDYDLVAKFTVTYKLFKNGVKIHEKSFDVDESVEHEQSIFGGGSKTLSLQQRIFWNKLIETSSKFWHSAKNKV